MTEAPQSDASPAREGLASTSRDLELDLLGLRLNGAQLGAMLGVRRQSVSKAVQSGRISPPGPDGAFDAKRAVREWMANSNPARVRARALRPGAEVIHELRERAQRLFTENAKLHDDLALEQKWGDERAAAARFAADDLAAKRLATFIDALAARFPEARDAHAAGRLSQWLDELEVVAYYSGDLDEYRRELDDSEEATGISTVGPYDASLDATCPELAGNSGQTRDAESRAPLDCPDCPECPE